MTTQIVMASTAFGLATVMAAYQSLALDHCERRILVVACTTAMPEATTPMRDIVGVPDLMSRFDAVYDYNTCIEPQHPTIWHPRRGDLPLWERHFRRLWELGNDDLHLVVESIHVNPAQALCRIFGDARIEVYADGLMSYGPTRSLVPEMLGCRIERLLHLDLVPGLTPLLLSERGVPSSAIPTESFRAVVKTMIADRAAPDGEDRVALIVGQYLAAGGLLSEVEELDLYAGMVSGCAKAGYSAVTFKPHPSSPTTQLARLREAARASGIAVAVADERELAEGWFERGCVELVVGCFSTALLTASSLYGLPVARLGTEMMLERLTPYQNSNRIPATLVDALIPDLSSVVGSDDLPPRAPDSLDALVLTVGYAMQPHRLAARRSEAEAFLVEHYETRAHYFKRRRLSTLGLPGRLPARPRPKPTMRRLLRWQMRRIRPLISVWLAGPARPQSGSGTKAASMR
jgi:hypothetical protein